MNRLNEEEKPQQNVRKAQERDKDAFLGSSRDGGVFLGVALFFFPSFSSFRKILWREVSYIAMAKVSLS